MPFIRELIQMSVRGVLCVFQAGDASVMATGPGTKNVLSSSKATRNWSSSEW